MNVFDWIVHKEIITGSWVVMIVSLYRAHLKASPRIYGSDNADI